MDKKSGALVILDGRSLSLSLSPLHHINSLPQIFLAETKTERGELVAINQFSVFIIGTGGFGGKRQSPALKVNKFITNAILKKICSYIHVALGILVTRLEYWFLILNLFLSLSTCVANCEASQPFSRCIAPNANPPLTGCPLPTQWGLQSFTH